MNWEVVGDDVPESVMGCLTNASTVSRTHTQDKHGIYFSIGFHTWSHSAHRNLLNVSEILSQLVQFLWPRTPQLLPTPLPLLLGGCGSGESGVLGILWGPREGDEPQPLHVTDYLCCPLLLHSSRHGDRVYGAMTFDVPVA